MASETTTTSDPDEIKQWVEEHGGRPASVSGTEGDDDAGVLRIDFPGGAGQSNGLEHIDLEAWFAKFDEEDLDFVYQKHKADGSDSTFFKLVKRD